MDPNPYRTGVGAMTDLIARLAAAMDAVEEIGK